MPGVPVGDAGRIRLDPVVGSGAGGHRGVGDLDRELQVGLELDPPSFLTCAL